jgi:hypothetical protein
MTFHLDFKCRAEFQCGLDSIVFSRELNTSIDSQ